MPRPKPVPHHFAVIQLAIDSVFDSENFKCGCQCKLYAAGNETFALSEVRSPPFSKFRLLPPLDEAALVLRLWIPLPARPARCASSLRHTFL